MNLTQKLRQLLCKHQISYDQVYRREDAKAVCLCRKCDLPIVADHGYQLDGMWVPPMRADWHKTEPRRAPLPPVEIRLRDSELERT